MLALTFSFSHNNTFKISLLYSHSHTLTLSSTHKLLHSHLSKKYIVTGQTVVVILPLLHLLQTEKGFNTHIGKGRKGQLPLTTGCQCNPCLHICALILLPVIYINVRKFDVFIARLT